MRNHCLKTMFYALGAMALLTIGMVIVMALVLEKPSTVTIPNIETVIGQKVIAVDSNHSILRIELENEMTLEVKPEKYTLSYKLLPYVAPTMETK